MNVFDVVELTRQMIIENTISDASNLKLAELIKDWLKQLGFDVEFQIQKFNQNSITKVNLIARFGPRDREALMFSGHMDTVPYGDLNDWTKDPFTPRLYDGKLGGLGAVDMKGSIAAMICAIEPLVKEPLRREIIFGLTFDEEIGLIGAKYLVESNLVKPKFIIIGEPTMMKPVRMHKGHIYVEVVCHGSSGHASDPEKGFNAIKVASEAITVIQQFADELKMSKCLEINPPYTTINIGTIHGGIKPNIIPSKCVINFDIRPIPGMTSQSLISDIKGRLENIGTFENRPLVSMQATRIPTEPVSTDQSSEIILIAERVTGERAHGVSYGTDGSILQKLSSQILILGPGSINNAHKPNEFVAINQLGLAVKQFREITRLICITQEERS
ncbi:acetylornithine deacetylase [Candidatus Azambacteria bacterium]|nr:acetylornithine deacetylase [Candidatus Azambacteria bacterium]